MNATPHEAATVRDSVPCYCGASPGCDDCGGAGYFPLDAAPAHLAVEAFLCGAIDEATLVRSAVLGAGQEWPLHEDDSLLRVPEDVQRRVLRAVARSGVRLPDYLADTLPAPASVAP